MNNHYFIWAMTVWGTVQIVTQSKLFAGFRGLFTPAEPGQPIRTLSQFFGSLFSCSLCFGWWVGAAVHLIGFGLLSNDMGIKAILVPEMFAPFGGDAVAVVPRSAAGWAIAVVMMILDGAAGSALSEGINAMADRLERR
jgi:hypothetical protein